MTTSEFLLKYGDRRLQRRPTPAGPLGLGAGGDPRISAHYDGFDQPGRRGVWTTFHQSQPFQPKDRLWAGFKLLCSAWGRRSDRDYGTGVPRRTLRAAPTLDRTNLALSQLGRLGLRRHPQRF